MSRGNPRRSPPQRAAVRTAESSTRSTPAELSRCIRLRRFTPICVVATLQPAIIAHVRKEYDSLQNSRRELTRKDQGGRIATGSDEVRLRGGHPGVDRRVTPRRKRHDARRASCRRTFTSSGAARREHPHAGRVGTTSPLSASLGGGGMITKPAATFRPPLFSTFAIVLPPGNSRKERFPKIRAR
jgi:hypothetical protein